MTKPLFISPEYLSDDVNGKIEKLFIDELARNKFNPSVLCCGASNYDKNEVHIIALRRNKYIAGFEKRHYIKLCLPDEYFLSWFLRCIFYVLLHKKSLECSYVHSFSVPYSTHLLGYIIKKLFKIKWVAQFYEPWSDNAYLKLDQSPRYKKRVSHWEELIANNADIIIHNSETARENWVAKYGNRDKVKWLNLPFKPIVMRNENIDDAIQEKDIVVTHIGHLYNLRNGKDIIFGASIFRREHPELFKSLKILFIGKVQSEDIMLIRREHLDNNIILLGCKTEEECLPFYNRSDAFIAIDGEGQGPLFFPSKLIKYYYYQKPILGITDSKSVLDNELIKTNHTSIRHNEPERVSNFFFKLAQYDERLNAFDRDAWKRFEVSSVINDYEKILIDKNLC